MTLKRRPDEKRRAFVERFMNDPQMVGHYPDEAARLAAAEAQAAKRPVRAAVDLMAFRSYELRARAAKGADDRTVDMLLATETPVKRRTWYGDEFYEVLKCGPENVDLSFFGAGRAPVLADHSRWEQIGVVAEAALDGRELRCTARFSKGSRGEQELQDVRDGIRQNVSVGYVIDPTGVRVIPATAEGGLDTIIIERWRPMEASFVAIPADEVSGVGRSGEGAFPRDLYRKARQGTTVDARSDELVVESPRNGLETPEEPPMKIKTGQNPEAQPADAGTSAAPDTTTTVQRDAAPTASPGAPAAAAPQAVAQVTDRGAEERARVEEILAIGDSMGMAREAREAVKAGTSSLDFRLAALRVLEQRTAAGARAPAVDLSANDRRRFNFANAVRAVVAQTWFRENSLEREVHNDLVKRFGLDPQNAMNSIFVPPDLMQRAPVLAGAAGSSMNGTGGALVPTVHGEFQPFLVNRNALVRAGVRVLDGLRGELVFPTGGTRPSAGTPQENGTQAKSATTFTAKRATAKPIRAGTDFSRTLLHNSSPSVDALLEDQLLTAGNDKLEQQMLYGSGASGQFSGIDDHLSDASIADVDFASDGAIAYLEFLKMIGAVDADKALIGPGSFVTSRSVVHKALATPRLGSGTSPGIMTGSPSGAQDVFYIDGIPVYTSHTIKQDNPTDLSPSTNTAHSCYFGVWNRTFLCLFGPAYEIIVDPFSGVADGRIDIWIEMQADFVMPIPKVARRANNLIVV